MDSSLQISSKSSIDQNSYDIYTIPKVSSDGEPHEVMTMVAAFSGLIAAIIVLVILIILIGCGNQSDRNNDQQQICSNNTLTEENHNNRTINTKMTIIPIFQNKKNSNENNSNQCDLAAVITTETSSAISQQHQEQLNQCYDNPICINDDEQSEYSHNQAKQQQNQINDELILEVISLPGIKTVRF